MGTIASQITSLAIVYSTVYSDADQRKHQSSVSLAFVRGIHRIPVNSPHKWPVTRKMFPFHDVIMSIDVRWPFLAGVFFVGLSCITPGVVSYQTTLGKRLVRHGQMWLCCPLFAWSNWELVESALILRRSLSVEIFVGSASNSDPGKQPWYVVRLSQVSLLMRHLVRSCEDMKPWDWLLNLTYHFEIRYAAWQYDCWIYCQTSNQ